MKADILGAAYFCERPQAASKTVCRQAGWDTRRLSPQSRFALAGVLPFANAGLPSETAVFLGVDFGSHSVFSAMQQNVRQGFAKPLDFLAHLHNAPVFHICAALGLTGMSAVEAVDGQPKHWLSVLFQAVLHVNETGGQALAGWCGESEDGADGESFWLHLAARAEGAAVRLECARADGIRADGFSDGNGAGFVQQAYALFAGLQAGARTQLPQVVPQTVWTVCAERPLPVSELLCAPNGR